MAASSRLIRLAPALLASDGTELATWQIAGTVEGEPVGGISEDGRYLGLAYGATLRIIELASGREEVIDSGFKTVSRLQITDDGVAYLSGFRYPSRHVPRRWRQHRSRLR
jgi:hypothetical protein